jgi:predicted RNA-binding Zn-ribbon protein involved in translation (DUF1610 family)
MATVTAFTTVDEGGSRVPADAYGNNVAFRCLNCGDPVLAVIRPHQRGSSPGNPSICRACGARFWIEARAPQTQLVVHRLP